MNEILGIFSMCFSLCFVLEGIDNAATKKTSFLYKVTHIGYPLFTTCTLFYFLVAGVIS